ncbi:hypothetical protein M0804_007631 [Polistes exclamans]|nr:hypothetical protein M0804_007631 [Polistes exclamans]
MDKLVLLGGLVGWLVGWLVVVGSGDCGGSSVGVGSVGLEITMRKYSIDLSNVEDCTRLFKNTTGQSRSLHMDMEIADEIAQPILKGRLD